MRILFLSAWYPYPADNGSKLRIFNLLKGLAKNHQIHLVSFTQETPVEKSQLLEICETLDVVRWKEGQTTGLNRLLAKFSTTPFSFLDTYSEQMVQAINLILDKHKIDVIIASQIKTASYAPYFRGVPAIFEEVELGVMYEQFASANTTRSKIRYSLTWWKHKRFLNKLLEYFRTVSVASEEEKQLFHTATQGSDVKLSVIPNGVDVARYADFREETEPETLIYTGSFGFWSNYEAMVWFVREVLPLVRKKYPNTILRITGNHKDLPLPLEEGVIRTGFVDDVRPLVAKSAISIAPLLTGGGTRLKILEAMALKTPVVATSKGSQGLEATAGEHCLIADSPEEFAQAIDQIFSDSNIAQQLSESGLELVQNKYDWPVILPLLEEALLCIND